MCGIAGFTRLHRTVDTETARRITRALRHRGPDQQGILEGKLATLCAVRLKIIDLGAGDQPFVSEDGDTAIAFNGEIYNHLEVRKELEARGHRFRSHCDTETVLRAFLEWDVGCFSKLRGMFAAAVWKESERRLVLARDRMGIKPLYYRVQGDDLLFGSEVKCILEHRDVPREMDLDALETYLSVNYVPGTRTLIAGIVKLPPGHLLEWRNGAIRLESWWRLPATEPTRRTLEDAKEELDHLMRSAIREQLVADVPLGIWASGGLDSSAVLHYAAEASPAKLKTFSVSFAGRNFDESRYFRDVARAYGTEHNEFDLNPGVELASAIEEFAYYSDEPSADAGALPVWYLAKMSRKQVTVALSGEGADELFGGYVTYVADALARPFRRVPAPLRRMADRLASLLPVSDEKIGLEYKLKRWVEGCELHPDDAHFFWNGTFSPNQLRAILPGANGGGMRALAEQVEAPAGLERYLRIDQSFYLPDDILYKTDRMSMAHSLEVRPPFLDHRIVEFAASLPERLKIQGFRQKIVLKELMRGKLPAAVVNRKKTGFDIPAHDWFRGPLREMLTDVVTPHAARVTGIFNERAIESLIRDHLGRRINAGYHLWGLLTLFLWMRRWKVGIARPEQAGEAAGALALTSQ